MLSGELEALTFDCYGTLIDWETGILNCLRPWAITNGIEVDDDGLLEAFARAESRCERAAPTDIYPDILRAAQRHIAVGFGVEADDESADQLARSVGDWPVFSDTVAALTALRRRYRLVIISNVDRTSFARTNEKLHVTFDAVVTAQDVGAYKPDERMFLRAFEVLDGMGIARGKTLHVAQSLYHDHVPAKRLGLTTVWVDRRRGRTGSGATREPGDSVTPDLVVGSMRELAVELDSGGAEV